jgi:hypothetical protein
MNMMNMNEYVPLYVFVRICMCENTIRMNMGMNMGIDGIRSGTS